MARVAVVQGAVCRCTSGTQVSLLDGIDDSVCMDMVPTANANDKEFIGNFGTCTVTGECCERATPEPWLSPEGAAEVRGAPPLVVDSLLICLKGGIIFIEEPGQNKCEWDTEIGAFDVENPIGWVTMGIAAKAVRAGIGGIQTLRGMVAGKGISFGTKVALTGLVGELSARRVMAVAIQRIPKSMDAAKASVFLSALEKAYRARPDLIGAPDVSPVRSKWELLKRLAEEKGTEELLEMIRKRREEYEKER